MTYQEKQEIIWEKIKDEFRGSSPDPSADDEDEEEVERPDLEEDTPI